MPFTEGASIDLTFIWGFVIAFAVWVYVLLDGFDLGIGMLYALEPEKTDRDVMMDSVAPVWDGNETWLVLGGGGLFAAFPLAYAVILPAVYIPIVLMLLALVFRGVAFEFRGHTHGETRAWDLSFMLGSAVATFCQGTALGAFLQGIEVDIPARAFAGSGFDWLTPFSVTVGIALIFGYALLGATWLVFKTEGTLQWRMRRRARWLALVTVGFIGIVSLWTPFLQEGYYSRWFEGFGIVAAVAVAVATLALTAWLLATLRHGGPDLTPFLLSLSLFTLCFIGLGFCVYPYIVPLEITIWQAAAPEKSQIFMLVGAAILIPIILAYTAYAYWVFRGKVDAETGYH